MTGPPQRLEMAVGRQDEVGALPESSYYLRQTSALVNLSVPVALTLDQYRMRYQARASLAIFQVRSPRAVSHAAV